MRAFTLIIATLLLLSSCNNESTKQTTTHTPKETTMQREQPETVTLKLGESFKEFYNNYPKAKVNRVGDEKYGYTTFYNFNWDVDNPATIHLEYDQGKVLELPYTIDMMVTEESEDSQKGIKEFQAQTGITKADLITYEEARKRFYYFLQNLLKAGWKRALSPYDPRISGRLAMHYKLTQEDMYYLDPSYEPTLEEWKKLETGGLGASNYWVLHYQNKIFLRINLGVTPHDSDANLASYLMFITIHDAEEEAMRYFDAEERNKWKELWHEVESESVVERKKTETKLKAKGYTIDESYEDYTIDPKEW